MATRTTTTVMDDLEQQAGRQVTAEHPDVEFTIDGKTHKIDLSEANLRRLLEIFAPYVSAGRRLKNPRRVAAASRQIAAYRRLMDGPAHPDDDRLQPEIPRPVGDPFNAAPKADAVVPPRFATKREADMAVREWGREQGLTVQQRGAISRDLRRMYREAHNGDPVIDG